MDDEKLEREAAKIIFSAAAKSDEETVPAEPQGPEIAFVCPFCNEAYRVSEELAGKKINCRNCREACRVDTKKRPRKPLNGWSFWVGFALGIGLTVVAVILLKLARLV
jgi:transcription elongation factor Elf1